MEKALELERDIYPTLDTVLDHSSVSWMRISLTMESNSMPQELLPKGDRNRFRNKHTSSRNHTPSGTPSDILEALWLSLSICFVCVGKFHPFPPRDRSDHDPQMEGEPDTQVQGNMSHKEKQQSRHSVYWLEGRDSALFSPSDTMNRLDMPIVLLSVSVSAAIVTTPRSTPSHPSGISGSGVSILHTW